MTDDSVPTLMRASVLHPDLSLSVESRPVPLPRADEVLVKVGSVGVCGSDVHYYQHGRIGDFVVEQPMVLGHESGGVIVAVGSEVSPARVGRRVSIEPQRPEPFSHETLHGHYNLDPAMEFYATPPIDGAFQEYVTIRSAFAYDIPDSMSDDSAALLEPLSVGVAAVRKAGITVGSSVLIAGAGPIGIVLALVARAYGASTVTVAEIDDARRQAVLDFGATAAVDLAAGAERFDAFIDASGAAAAVQSGIGALRPAGTAVLVGMGQSTVPLPVSTIQNRELIVTGLFRYANTWPTAIALASEVIDLDRLVTGRFGLDQVEAALTSATASTTIKSIVRPSDRAL